MKVLELPIDALVEAPWNANRMDEAVIGKLRMSIKRYGNVLNLVCYPLKNGTYEVLGGNQRLKILRESGATTVPCVVVELSDADARLLSQALNNIHGEDDLGLRAELLRKVMEAIPEEDILAVLPETGNTLKSLASLGQESIAEHLEKWQQAQGAKLKHLVFQVTQTQRDLIEEALAEVMASAKKALGDGPNRRGTALFQLCKEYLEGKGTL